MRSNRQRRMELKRKRAVKRAKALAQQQVDRLKGEVVVDCLLLRPSSSYGWPDFVTRGFYIEIGFRCKNCGKDEVWTPEQQRWWYEVAKGDVYTIATRCRTCRRRERLRRNEARRVSLEGLARKRQAAARTISPPSPAELPQPLSTDT